MKRWLRDQSLTLVMLGLFVIFFLGQAVSGHLAYNQEQLAHCQAALGFWAYMGSSHFLEALFENWESEFLQMGLYVLLTSFLYQRGSSESKDPDQPEADETPKTPGPAPWPLRRGGWIARLYEHSLAIALLSLFAFSITLHAIEGTKAFNQEQLAHGQAPLAAWQFVANPEFWFQSFQNWQSEFLAVASLILLSIFLRQKGSSQSKSLTAPNEETGSG